MLSAIDAFLASERIENYGVVPLRACKIRKQYLLDRCDIGHEGSMLVLIAPYYLDGGEGNLSRYAVPRDYHLYFATLFERLETVLKDLFPLYRFCGYADHSPVNEVHAAAVAGLGVIGDHHLLITPDYGSFVFIGGVFSNLPADAFGSLHRIYPPATCLHCGRCRESCTNHEECLSALTQKKGVLTPEQTERIRCSGMIWGCDVCQLVCPMQSVRETPIPFFREALTPSLTPELLDAMDDEALAERAYAWRGRAVLERNLKIQFEDFEDRE